MRVWKQETDKKFRVLMAISDEEILILQKLLDKAISVLPKGISPDYDLVEKRMRDMCKKMSAYLVGKPEDAPSALHKPKTHPCPYCKRVSRGQEALDKHIKMVHTEVKV